MSHNFSMKELLQLRKRKSSKKSAHLTAESYKEEADVLSLIRGNSVLERLKKYAHVKSMVPLPQDEANKIAGIVGGKNIAVCLVIIDKLNHEAIWRRWVEQSERCGYTASLHIHAKHPERIESEWVKERTLQHSFLPEWNSPEVIRAILATISDALNNMETGRVVLGTESCIPIATLKEVGDNFFSKEMSWLQAYNKGKTTYEDHKCFWAVDSKLIPSEYVWKSLPGWIMLTRKHAEAIISLPQKVGCDDFVVAWNEVHAPEEVYFPTMLALVGFLRDSNRGPDEVLRQPSTFAEWKRPSDANPVNFDSLTSELLQRLRSSGAMFARKFRVDTVDVDHWEKLVNDFSLPKSSDEGISAWPQNTDKFLSKAEECSVSDDPCCQYQNNSSTRCKSDSTSPNKKRKL